jgi:hypothetical protein
MRGCLNEWTIFGSRSLAAYRAMADEYARLSDQRMIEMRANLQRTNGSPGPRCRAIVPTGSAQGTMQRGGWNPRLGGRSVSGDWRAGYDQEKRRWMPIHAICRG